MQKLRIVPLCLGLLCFCQLALAKQAGSSGVLEFTVFNQKPEQDIDYRLVRLAFFFHQKDSPLTPFSWEFIKAADFWGVDWRLLPAIAGVESNFGKRIIPGSFNAYGWAGGQWRFTSWPDSIWEVTKKLRLLYYDRGLIRPTDIGRVYAPANPSWGKAVEQIILRLSEM